MKKERGGIKIKDITGRKATQAPLYSWIKLLACFKVEVIDKEQYMSYDKNRYKDQGTCPKPLIFLKLFMIHILE